MGTSILIFRRRENDKPDINGWYPDLCEFEPSYSPMDYLVDDTGDYFAVAFDPHGRLGWKSSRIIDDDPGYGGAQIIEVLTRQVSRQYLTYLQSMAFG